MVFSSNELSRYYNDVVNKYEKIRSEVNKKRITKIRRGVYSTNANADRLCIANKIIPNSYISYEYALYYYGLIPERVTAITSATHDKNRKNVINTQITKYIYQDVPSSAFSDGLTCIRDEGNNYVRIATKEKAICDRLSVVPQIRSIKDIKELLFDDLRIDYQDFLKLNLNELLRLSSLYHKPTLDTLNKFTRSIL